MEPVKTCVTCRHSLVARLHPADWFKRRLCGHPGMVDRVEGKPLNACDEARQAEQPCGIKGGLWDGVEAKEAYDPRKPYGEGVLGAQMNEVANRMFPVPESRSLPPFPGSNGPAVFSGDAVKLPDPIDLAMRLRPRGRE